MHIFAQKVILFQKTHQQDVLLQDTDLIQQEYFRIHQDHRNLPVHRLVDYQPTHDMFECTDYLHLKP